MTKTTLTKEDDGTTIELEPGDSFDVRLDEIPTSGYRWTVHQTEGNELTEEGSDFTQASGTGVGGGGTRTLTFDARRPGTAALKFELRREWEPDQAEDQFEITVQIRE
jgi:inhibitor of cysteine peptidase